MVAVTIHSDFRAQREEICHCFHLFPSIYHEVMGLDAMILVFLILSFKPAFSLSSFTLIKRLFSSSLLSAIRVVSSAWGCWYFSQQFWFQLMIHPAQYMYVCVLVDQSCPTLCNPMDCSPPGFSVHEILQERILEWVAIPFTRDLPDSGIEPRSLASQIDSLPSEPPGKPSPTCSHIQFSKQLLNSYYELLPC